MGTGYRPPPHLKWTEGGGGKMLNGRGILHPLDTQGVPSPHLSAFGHTGENFTDTIFK